jgi:hypothetical protein
MSRSMTAIPKRVKGVLQAMIDGIRVDARDRIEPTFRVPAVRIESGFMVLVGLLSNPVGPLKTLLDGSLPECPGPCPLNEEADSTRVRTRHRRAGWVVAAIVQVLADRQESMQARAVHAAVEALLGEPVCWSSVKASLAANVSGASPRFERVGQGRYRLAGLD